MLYINKITSDAQQQLILTGIPNETITMTLRYMPRIQQWVMGIVWGDFEAQGIAVVNSLNLLRQWRNVIPFGICCLRADGLDPYQNTDFSDEIANLYLLDGSDVAAIEAAWFS